MTDAAATPTSSGARRPETLVGPVPAGDTRPVPLYVLALLATLAAVLLALAALTAVGAHERGMRWPLASLVGAVFPATWTAWYLRDGAHRRRRTA